jgi:ERF superfamily
MRMIAVQQSSGSIGSLAAALARAQVELINPEKSMVATIRPEGRGAAEQIFRYAPLSDGLNIIRKTLGQHEIATLQSTSVDQTAGLIRLKTVLAHSSGEWISSDWPVCPLEDLASPKRMGAALTYARRYALFALVGIAGEDDLDAPDLHTVEPVDPRGAHAVSHHRPRPNGGDAQLGRKPTAKPRAELSPAPADSGLRRKLSAVLRDQLLRDVGNLNSAEGAAVWARRILPAKNTLHEADARQVEEAFEAKITAINGQSNSASVGDGHDVLQASLTNGDVPPASSAAAGQTAEAIDKTELVHPEPRRIRDRDHLRFVSTQPCLICGRTPADPHHLRFAQSRALSRKVSDEFIVPLCRGHHREVHRCSDETAWWRDRGIDALGVARVLWLEFHPQVPNNREAIL